MNIPNKGNRIWKVPEGRERFHMSVGEDARELQGVRVEKLEQILHTLLANVEI